MVYKSHAKKLVYEVQKLYPPLPGLGRRRKETDPKALNELKRVANESRQIILNSSELRIISQCAFFILDDERLAIDWDAMIGYTHEEVRGVVANIESSL